MIFPLHHHNHQKWVGELGLISPNLLHIGTVPAAQWFRRRELGMFRDNSSPGQHWDWNRKNRNRTFPTNHPATNELRTPQIFFIINITIHPCSTLYPPLLNIICLILSYTVMRSGYCLQSMSSSISCCLTFILIIVVVGWPIGLDTVETSVDLKV